MGARRLLPPLAATGLALALSLVPGAGREVLALTTAIDDAYGVDEDSPLVVGAAEGVLANDSSDEGDLCVTGTVAGDFEGSLDGVREDGSFTYTPPADFNGTTSFGYSVALLVDGVCGEDIAGNATVTITVNPVNDPPVAQSDTLQALRDQPLNVAAPGVLGNDFDVDGDSLSAVKVSNPAHGTVTLAADGAFVYIPATGYAGPDAFSYRASDGTLTSQVRAVSITVTALPTAQPTVAPTPTPTPAPTPTAEPTPSASAEGSASPDPFASASAGPSAGPSASPLASLGPEEPAAGEGGLPIPVIGVGLLLLALLAFGGAVVLPKWLERRNAAEDWPSPE